MPAPVRPKGSGGSRNAAPVTPMSERQQMALLMQLTSTNNDVGSRSPSSSSGGGGARSRERNERGETPLHLAAIKGDVEQVSKLLAHRADPNAADFAGTIEIFYFHFLPTGFIIYLRGSSTLLPLFTFLPMSFSGSSAYKNEA